MKHPDVGRTQGVLLFFTGLVGSIANTSNRQNAHYGVPPSRSFLDSRVALHEFSVSVCLNFCLIKLRKFIKIDTHNARYGKRKLAGSQDHFSELFKFRTLLLFTIFCSSRFSGWGIRKSLLLLGTVVEFRNLFWISWKLITFRLLLTKVLLTKSLISWISTLLLAIFHDFLLAELWEKCYFCA